MKIFLPKMKIFLFFCKKVRFFQKSSKIDNIFVQKMKNFFKLLQVLAASSWWKESMVEMKVKPLLNLSTLKRPKWKPKMNQNLLNLLNTRNKIRIEILILKINKVIFTKNAFCISKYFFRDARWNDFLKKSKYCFQN